MDESSAIPWDAAASAGEASLERRADEAARALELIVRLAQAGDWKQAEQAIDALLDGIAETELPMAYIGLVEQLHHLAEPRIGPDPIVIAERPLPQARPRADLRRNYTYAILTALRVHLTPKVLPLDRSAA